MKRREKEGGHLIKFEQEGLKELHFFAEGINFPIAIPIYDDWQKTQFQYLLSNIKSTKFSSFDICKWCIIHKLQYQIIYPIGKVSILKNPYKYFMYKQMCIKLKKFSLEKY